jgi:hypothetical protein
VSVNAVEHGMQGLAGAVVKQAHQQTTDWRLRWAECPQLVDEVAVEAEEGATGKFAVATRLGMVVVEEVEVAARSQAWSHVTPEKELACHDSDSQAQHLWVEEWQQGLEIGRADQLGGEGEVVVVVMRPSLGLGLLKRRGEAVGVHEGALLIEQSQVHLMIEVVAVEEMQVAVDEATQIAEVVGVPQGVVVTVLGQSP